MKEFIKPMAIFGIVLSAWALVGWAVASILMNAVLFNANEKVAGSIVSATLIIGLFISIWLATTLVRKTS